MNLTRVIENYDRAWSAKLASYKALYELRRERKRHAPNADLERCKEAIATVRAEVEAWHRALMVAVEEQTPELMDAINNKINAASDLILQLEAVKLEYEAEQKKWNEYQRRYYRCRKGGNKGNRRGRKPSKNSQKQ